VDGLGGAVGRSLIVVEAVKDGNADSIHEK
jgi:hypothetical protein